MKQVNPFFKNVLFGVSVIFLAQASRADSSLVPYAVIPEKTPCGARMTYDPFGLEEGFVIKTDLMQSLQDNGAALIKRGFPKVEGALNFRETKAGLIFGLSQPTEAGYANTIQTIRSLHPEVKKIVWINLREEPALMIDGVPYGMHTISDPKDNVASGVIGREKIAKYEQHLLDWVRKKLKENHFKLPYFTEDSDVLAENLHTLTLQSKSKLETLTESLNKQNEKFEAIGAHFYRVPISDELAPADNDFDTLKAIFDQNSSDTEETAYVMNCQFGHGRTTTGDVIFEMLRYHAKSKVIPMSTVTDGIPELQAIERLIPRGKEASALTNRAIDLNDTVINLRENVINKIAKLKANPGDQTLEDNLGKSLKRYATLVTFQSYLLDPTSQTVLFSNWIKLHPDLKKALQSPIKSFR